MGYEVTFTLGLLSIITTLIILSVGLNNKHTPLKILFLLISFSNLLILNRGVGKILSDNGYSTTANLINNTTYPLLLWGLVITTIIIIILFIADIFNYFRRKNQAKKYYLFGDGW